MTLLQKIGGLSLVASVICLALTFHEHRWGYVAVFVVEFFWLIYALVENIRAERRWKEK